MSPSEQIDKHINSYNDWRGELLKKLRNLIHEADPEIQETWKWDVPVFDHNGMVCAISAFKDHVKINFFKGAKINSKLFNSGLDSKAHRSIDFSEGEQINEEGVKNLIKEAVSLNTKKI